MFDRYTERGRKVMSLARLEAQRLYHDYIGTEHILLALVKEGTGVASVVLREMGVELKEIRSEIERTVERGPEPVSASQQLPYTPRAKKVIELSLEEARNLGHHYIGTEHLLLGLLREHDGYAAQVLIGIGLKLEDLRDEVHGFLGSEVRSGGARKVTPEVRLRAEPPAAGAPVRKWEYTIAEAPGSWADPSARAELERKLNEMGEQGWEIVRLEVVEGEGQGSVIAFAKREKP